MLIVGDSDIKSIGRVWLKLERLGNYAFTDLFNLQPIMFLRLG